MLRISVIPHFFAVRSPRIICEYWQICLVFRRLRLVFSALLPVNSTAPSPRRCKFGRALRHNYPSVKLAVKLQVRFSWYVQSRESFVSNLVPQLKRRPRWCSPSPLAAAHVLYSSLSSSSHLPCPTACSRLPASSKSSEARPQPTHVPSAEMTYSGTAHLVRNRGKPYMRWMAFGGPAACMGDLCLCGVEATCVDRSTTSAVLP